MVYSKWQLPVKIIFLLSGCIESLGGWYGEQFRCHLPGFPLKRTGLHLLWWSAMINGKNKQMSIILQADAILRMSDKTQGSNRVSTMLQTFIEGDTFLLSSSFHQFWQKLLIHRLDNFIFDSFICQGFDRSTNVLVVCATNYPGSLPPALLSRYSRYQKS